MGNFKNSQKGYGTVESLLILIIVAILGFTGWFVYNSNKKTNVTYNSASQIANSASPKYSKITSSKSNIDPTADWTSYKSTDKSFMLKYPKSWVQAIHPDLCAGGILLIAPTANSVGKCGSEGFGEVAFISSGSHACFPFDDTYTNVTTNKITISGIEGIKQTAVSKDTASQGLGGLPAGTQVIQYCFNTDTKHYTALYNQQPGYPDAKSDFNLIVTKTLKFE